MLIIGGGPSGLLLSQLLHRKGIDTILLERKSKDYVLGRIRAGILEQGLVELMREAGVGARMDQECFIHDGTIIANRNDTFRIDFSELTGTSVVVYGQTELTRDLYEAREAMDGNLIFEVANVEINDADTDQTAM